jgi:hypothetical protein
MAGETPPGSTEARVSPDAGKVRPARATVSGSRGEILQS